MDGSGGDVSHLPSSAGIAHRCAFYHPAMTPVRSAPTPPAAPATAAEDPTVVASVPPGQWSALARAVLLRSGAEADVDPYQALQTVGLDGIAAKPVYFAEDADRRYVPEDATGAAGDGNSPAASSWDIRSLHADDDAARANSAVLDDLAGGAGSIWLRMGPAGSRVDELPRVLAEVQLSIAGVVLDAVDPDVAVTAAERLLALAGDGPLSGSLGFDLVRPYLTGGPTLDAGRLRELALATASHTPGLRLVTVDASAVHAAGAHDVDELAWATAAGVAHLRELEPIIGTTAAFQALEFRFAVTDDQFRQIAKLRAGRRLWARVAELAGVDVPQHQHGVTSGPMMTERDPWVNLLRTTVACFAAAVAGADAITVLPFDAAIGRSDGFARRLARNTQAIVHDEASLARVLDPAAGSWYVESLTAAIADAAWDRFTAIERAGGIIAALGNGEDDVLAALAAARRRRSQLVATRQYPITGVSEFADLEELAVHRDGPGVLAGVRRWAAPFEELRRRSDEHLAGTGSRPAVTLYAVGQRRAYADRVSFASNLLAAGGFLTPVVVAPEPAAGQVVCVCSADRDTAEQAVAAARAAGATQVWMAAPPGLGSQVPVDGDLSPGCDAVAVLTRIWECFEQVPA